MTTSAKQYLDEYGDYCDRKAHDDLWRARYSRTKDAEYWTFEDGSRLVVERDKHVLREDL